MSKQSTTAAEIGLSPLDIDDLILLATRGASELRYYLKTGALELDGYDAQEIQGMRDLAARAGSLLSKLEAGVSNG